MQQVVIKSRSFHTYNKRSTANKLRRTMRFKSHEGELSSRLKLKYTCMHINSTDTIRTRRGGSSAVRLKTRENNESTKPIKTYSYRKRIAEVAGHRQQVMLMIGF